MSNPYNRAEYNRDFYAWTLKSAELLRQRNFKELDLDNIAEELEGMGKSDKRVLVSHLSTLIMHLLKCKFQARRRGIIWENTIERQRLDIQELLDESPSLKYELAAKFNFAYARASLDAATATGIEKNALPRTCPFTLEQCLDLKFFPD